MGTHISRVKSVDLDSWTDEQLQSVLNWGNARANKSVLARTTKTWLLTATQILGSKAGARPCPVRSVSREHQAHKALMALTERASEKLKTLSVQSMSRSGGRWKGLYRILQP